MTADLPTPGRAALPLTRAELLRRSAALCAATGGAGLLAACSSSNAASPLGSSDSGTFRQRMRKTTALTVVNWPKFIDTSSDGGHPTIQELAAQQGISELSHQESITRKEPSAAKDAGPL